MTTFLEKTSASSFVCQEGRSRMMSEKQHFDWATGVGGDFMDALEATAAWGRMKNTPDWQRDSNGRLNALRLLVHLTDEVIGGNSMPMP
jgi:hypothetical protein